MSRGRKERTPAQLAVLAQAREKAKIVIAERAKLNALAKEEAVSEEEPPPPPEPEAEPEDPPPPPTLEHVSQPENEDEAVFCNAFIFALSAMTIFAFSRAWARTASWAGVRSLRPCDS